MSRSASTNVHAGSVRKLSALWRLIADVVVVGERVDRRHLVAIGEEGIGEVRADEPGGAGHQSVHGVLSVNRCSGAG